MQLSAGFAGTERHAIELVNALAADHDVALLIRSRPRERHRHAQYDAMRRAIKPSVRVFTAPRALPVPALAGALLRFRPDVVHAHYERSARIAGRWTFGAPVLATVHVYWCERAFGRCGGVICLTPEQEAEVPAHYPGLRFVIGGWVLPHRPAPARVAELRAEFGLPQTGAFILGTAGRLDAGKGVAELLEAFASAELANAFLIIAGEGEERAALERLAGRLGIGGRVVFTGFRPDIRDLYGLFDVFVSNSRNESYGLAILEAAAAGVPVIASQTRGACAIAREHPLRLVPIGDTGALRAALREALCRPVAPIPPLAGFGVTDRLPAILDAYDRVRALSSPSRTWRFPNIASWRKPRSEAV